MNIIDNSCPRDDGYHMPAEFSAHDGTIMIYPVRPGSWGKDRSNALRAFSKIFLEIIKRENLYLLADKAHWDEAKELMDCVIADYTQDPQKASTLENRCLILPIEADDAWARDVGPTFVVKEKDNRQEADAIRGINWRFNAWGGEYDGLYASWDKDDKVASSFCDMCEIEYYDASHLFLRVVQSIQTAKELQL